jgi:hypothetical protein
MKYQSQTASLTMQQTTRVTRIDHHAMRTHPRLAACHPCAPHPQKQCFDVTHPSMLLVWIIVEAYTHHTLNIMALWPHQHKHHPSQYNACKRPTLFCSLFTGHLPYWAGGISPSHDTITPMPRSTQRGHMFVIPGTVHICMALRYPYA